MDPIVILAIALVGSTVAVFWFFTRKHTSAQLGGRFAPEYDETVYDDTVRRLGDPKQAEPESLQPPQ